MTESVGDDHQHIRIAAPTYVRRGLSIFCTVYTLARMLRFLSYDRAYLILREAESIGKKAAGLALGVATVFRWNWRRVRRKAHPNGKPTS